MSKATLSPRAETRDAGVPLSLVMWFRLGRQRTVGLIAHGVLVTFGVNRLVQRGAEDWSGWFIAGTGLLMIVSPLVCPRNPFAIRPSPLQRSALLRPVTRENIWVIAALNFALAMAVFSEHPKVAVTCAVFSLASLLMARVQLRRAERSAAGHPRKDLEDPGRPSVR